MIYQMFLTNAVEHFNATDGLQAIPGWAQRAELQIEFAVTESDRTGARFAPNGAPGQWLTDRGVEVWYYVNPVAPVLLASQTRVLQEETPQSSPFWWRVRQANAIIGNNWILRDGKGQPVIGNGRQRPVADIGNPAYIEWLGDAIIQTGVKRVRLDDYNVHQHAFHRPQRAAWQDGSDSVGLLGMRELCARLRAACILVAANGGWEMSNPDLNPDRWHYPLMGYLDGVMIELLHKPGEGKANTGFAKWGDGKFWTLDLVYLDTVLDHWRDAGADVTLAVTWRGGPGVYESFARAWCEPARTGNYWLYTGREPGATHRVDKYPLPTPPMPEPEQPTAPHIAAELQHIRLDIAAAKALLSKAANRLQILISDT